MFISEQEANRRLNSSENVLTVIDKDGADPNGEAHDVEPPFVIPDEVLDPEDYDCASAQEIGLVPSGKLLKRMLGMPQGGRRKGQTNMDPVIRAATAVTAQLVNTQTAANVFETSYHHADELKHGFHSQAARYGGEDPNPDLDKEIKRQKKQVRDLAFEKLTKTLGLMTDDKLIAVTDPVKLARISKDLSGVVEKTLPKEQMDLGGVHFHVWRPEMKTETDYEQVTVGGQR